MSSAPTLDGDEPSVLAPLPPMHNSLNSIQVSSYGNGASDRSSHYNSQGNLLTVGAGNGSSRSAASGEKKSRSARSHNSHVSNASSSSKPYSVPLPPLSSLFNANGSETHEFPISENSHISNHKINVGKSKKDEDGEVDIYTGSTSPKKNRILLFFSIGFLVITAVVVGSMFGLRVFTFGEIGFRASGKALAQQVNSSQNATSDESKELSVSDEYIKNEGGNVTLQANGSIKDEYTLTRKDQNPADELVGSNTTDYSGIANSLYQNSGSMLENYGSSNTSQTGSEGADIYELFGGDGVNFYNATFGTDSPTPGSSAPSESVIFPTPSTSRPTPYPYVSTSSPEQVGSNVTTYSPVDRSSLNPSSLLIFPPTQPPNVDHSKAPTKFPSRSLSSLPTNIPTFMPTATAATSLPTLPAFVSEPPSTIEPELSSATEPT